MLELFPAIDLKDGQVVRLTQGDYDRVQVFSSDPVQIAKEFCANGACNLHVVDLDGAKDGTLVNTDTIAKIVQGSGLKVQIGGGIRDEQAILRYLELGVQRVILGTVAIEDFGFLTRMVACYGDKIAVGVDAKDQKVAVKGWKEITAVDSVEFCKRLEQAGVSTIIYTDISKDGAMAGTNMDIYKLLATTVSCNIIASGGITNISELTQLAKTKTYGAIIGKALYLGNINLQEAVQLCNKIK